ncbi:MAG: hypothetical protein CR971_00665 [candidate division SR1 bacterium]|nr:MAG: hypothetical protein CR971_00665 [candidate division SR1 bacterium]
MELKKILALLCILGGGFLIIPTVINLPKKLDIIQNGNTTTGKIIQICNEHLDIKTDGRYKNCHVKIQYKDAEKKITAWSEEPFFHLAFSKGEIVKIYYTPGKNNFVIDSVFTKYVIVGEDLLFGCIALIAGIILSISYIKKIYIRRFGVLLETTIIKSERKKQEINLNILWKTNTIYNIIYSEYKENGKKYIFKSEDSQFIGNKLLEKYKIGDTIKVYAKKNDYSQYVMDIPEISRQQTP